MHPNTPGYRPPAPTCTCSNIPRHPFPGSQQERRITHQVVQIIEPAQPIGLRPTVQIDLHLPYHHSRPDRNSPGGAGIHRRVFGHCSLLLD